MTPEERARKIRELMADHQAAGGYISRKEAERIIDEVEAKMKEGEGEWLLVLGWECDGVDPERVKRGSDRGGSAECLAPSLS